MFWMWAGDVVCNSTVRRTTLVQADKCVGVWAQNDRVYVAFDGIIIPGLGFKKGVAVVDAGAVTMSPVWYAALEFHLFVHLQDAAAFDLADIRLRSKNRVTLSFTCKVVLPPGPTALVVAQYAKLAEVRHRQSYTPPHEDLTRIKFDQLFHRCCTEAEQRTPRLQGLSAVRAVCLRGLRLTQKDLSWAPKLAGVFGGCFTFSSLAAYLEVYALEARKLFKDVVDSFLVSGQLPEPPAMMTIAVEAAAKKFRTKKIKKVVPCWNFTGLMFCHELGSNFVREINRVAVDALRCLPAATGDKIWLWCQTTAPVRGQGELWTPDQWWPFVYEKVGGNWHHHTGVNGVKEATTWHAFQQFTRVKVFLPAVYARSWHPKQEVVSRLSAMNWQRITGAAAGCTQENVRAAVLPVDRLRLHLHLPGDVDNCIRNEDAMDDWRARLLTQAILAGANDNGLAQASIDDDTAGELRAHSQRSHARAAALFL